MGSPAQSSAVLFERREHIGIITLNRPEAMNAVNAALATALGNLLDEYSADPEIWSVVITGRGRGLCAGADLVGSGAIAAGTLQRAPLSSGPRTGHTITLREPIRGGLAAPSMRPLATRPVAIGIEGSAVPVLSAVVPGCDLLASTR